MAIDTRRIGDVTILALAGPLVVERFGALKAEVRSLVDGGWRKVVLDLGGVSYVDSIGIAEIIRAHTMLACRGGRLALIHLPDRVRELLRVTGLLAVLDHHGEQAALASLAAERR